MNNKNISEAAIIENVKSAPTTRIFDAYVKNTRIGDRSIIRDGSRVENSEFGNNVDLSKSELTKSIQDVANVDNMSTIEFEKNAGWKIRYVVPKGEMRSFRGYELIKNN